MELKKITKKDHQYTDIHTANKKQPKLIAKRFQKQFLKNRQK